MLNLVFVGFADFKGLSLSISIEIRLCDEGDLLTKNSSAKGFNIDFHSTPPNTVEFSTLKGLVSRLPLTMNDAND